MYMYISITNLVHVFSCASVPVLCAPLFSSWSVPRILWWTRRRHPLCLPGSVGLFPKQCRWAHGGEKGTEKLKEFLVKHRGLFKFKRHLQISLDGMGPLVPQSLEYCRHLHFSVVGDQVPIGHLDCCICSRTSCKGKNKENFNLPKPQNWPIPALQWISTEHFRATANFWTVPRSWRNAAGDSGTSRSGHPS